jgi:ubiquinone/menaquinone biosynthesis C-methylase UbiE
MTRALATLAVITLLCLPGAAQQTALTDAHLRSAEIEIPQLVTLLELKPGMTVADVGAGFGAWTMGFARWLGPQGRVYATDIGAPQLSALRDLVKREGLNNVTVVAAGVTSTNLPAGCCDAILLRDSYHHLTDPQAIIRSLAAALKPGGRLAIVDFAPRPGSDVPSGVPADRLGHGIPPAVIEREGGTALTHVRTILEWSPKSQPADLYLVLFRKP